MTYKLSLLDRLRIERVVWELDQRVYDLPYRRRIAVRREVRDNLGTAAADVGAKQAVRNMGSVAILAAGYLEAQFGGRPRPSLMAAALFVFTTPLVLQSILTDAALAFRDGVLATNPDFAGTQRWNGIQYLQTEVTFTFSNHSATLTGGVMSPLAWLLLAIGGIAVGRLWRLLPRRTRQQQPGGASSG
jgi:hypothetical protein